MFHRVVKYNDDQQIVTGEVYAPNVIDSHGEMMLPEDVETLAHRFLQLATLKDSIDTRHNNVPITAYPVESFIARGHPDYNEGAWVASVKIDDAEVWAEVKAGGFNGFSWQAMVYKEPAVATVLINPEVIGETEAASDGHTHFFFAELNADGKVTKGRTSTTNGHAHAIMAGTATEVEAGHAHRFFI